MKGKYRLGCASGILDVTYGANELNLVEADFPELDNIPSRKLSLGKLQKHKASLMQSPVDKPGVCVNVHALIVDAAVEKLNRNASSSQNSWVYVL